MSKQQDFTYNKNEVRIVGHLNADVDSIASTISYSYLKNHLSQEKNYFPYIGNEMTHQAKEVLSMLKIDPPEVLDTLKLQAKDIMMPAQGCISEERSMLEALSQMKENNIRSLPVVNNKSELTGVFTESVVTETIMQSFLGSISQIPVTLPLIKDTLKAKELFIPKKKCKLSNTIITCALDKKKIEKIFKKGDIAIIGDREDVLEILLERKVALVILTKGSKVSAEKMKLVKKKNTAFFSTPFDTFQTSKLISLAVPLKKFMIAEPLFLRPENHAEKVKKFALMARYAVPVVDRKRHVVGVISRSDLARPRQKKVIMMDHNEKSQAINGIEEAEIIEIVDHHRFAGLATNKPINIKTKPVGSTSTIVAESFFEHGVKVPTNLSKLLLAAICSDTLVFQSPTSTKKDQEIANKLAKANKINLKKFGRQVLEAADVSAAMTPSEMLDNDRKEFLFGNRKLHIAQLETTSYKWLDKIKGKLLEAMDDLVTKSAIDGILLMVTHVLQKETRLLVKTKDTFYIEEIFGKNITNDEIFLPSVVSRKKQIVSLFGV